ncbi:MAG: GNAT family N-acetyltransferase [Pseudomonadota bacterium]
MRLLPEMPAAKDAHEGGGAYAGQPRLADIAFIRPVALCEYSDLRHLHASAMRAAAARDLAGDGTVLSDALSGGISAYIYGVGYLERLTSVMLFGAWIDTLLVASCSWRTDPFDPRVGIIDDLFVSPLFDRAGLGDRLLTHVENHAGERGVERYVVEATGSARHFLARAGYGDSGIYRTVVEDEATPLRMFRFEKATPASVAVSAAGASQ